MLKLSTCQWAEWMLQRSTQQQGVCNVATKVKVEVEKPMYVVVEQTTRPGADRYRVVLQRNIKAGSITMDKVEYKLVAEHQPSINAHAFRVWCQEKNLVIKLEQQKIQAQRDLEARQAAQQQAEANRQKREEEQKNARQNRWQERRTEGRRARIILKEQSIARRKMDEAASGERDPALRHLQRQSY